MSFSQKEENEKEEEEREKGERGGGGVRVEVEKICNMYINDARGALHLPIDLPVGGFPPGWRPSPAP